MSSRLLKKTIVIVAGLLTAGFLTVAAAAMERLFPRGSTLAFVARMVPVVVLVPALMVGFLAACDWCLGLFGRRQKQLLAEVFCQSASSARREELDRSVSASVTATCSLA